MSTESTIAGSGYATQLASGLYDSIADQLVAMGKASLAACDYSKDFFRKVEAWSGNYVYRDDANGEFRANIVGEIAAASSGTIVSAKGNHYAGKPGDFLPITDESKCKDILALRVPSLACALLKILFFNQVGTLNDVRESDETEERQANENPPVRDWVRAPGSDATATKEIIIIHTAPKYCNPGGTGGDTSRGKRVQKRSLDSVDDENKTKAKDALPEVKLGAFYDPALSPDFGGSFFDLTHNKLVQHDIRDEDNNLVPAWKFYEVLRPGTLILANVSMHCFIMKERGGHRKIYQLNLHSARILARPDTAVVVPERPVVPLSSSTSDSPKPSVGSKSYEASSALANFVTTPRISPVTTPEGSFAASPVLSSTTTPATSLEKGLAPSPASSSKTTPDPPGEASKATLTEVTPARPSTAVPSHPSGLASAQSSAQSGNSSGAHVDKKPRKTRSKEVATKADGTSGAMDTSA